MKETKRLYCSWKTNSSQSVGNASNPIVEEIKKKMKNTHTVEVVVRNLFNVISAKVLNFKLGMTSIKIHSERIYYLVTFSEHRKTN